MKTHRVHKHPVPADYYSRREASSRESRPAAYLVYVALTLLLIVSAAAAVPPSTEEDAPASRWHGHWTQVAPMEVGYDADRLEAAIAAVGQMRGVQGLLVVRHGYLVAERYWRGGAQNVPHNLKSASKSVISALVGIAIEGGYFTLDQPIVELLPGRRVVDDPAKKEITVQHLLTMTSGLQSKSFQAYNEWVTRPDWIKSVLAQPLASQPGTRYDYNTANSHLLSAILAAQTGQTTRAFAQSRLFDPMGIEIHDWSTDPDGIHIGGNNLWLMPRDLAKFGQLYLDRGQFGDRRLISADWVAASTRPDGRASHETYGGYGYLWWTPNGDGSFAAVGYGGQYILVSPREDTVIVITSTLASKGDHWENKLFGLLRQGIGGSLVSPQLPQSGVTVASVNLRSAPRGDGSKLGVITEGERFDLFARDGGWLKVRVRGLEGWLRSDFVTLTALAASVVPQPLPEQQRNSAAPMSVAEEERRDDLVPVPEARLERLRAQAKALNDMAHDPAPLPRYRITGLVNFRRSPNLLGDRLGQLRPGTEFQALERSEAWLMARVDGEQGWVHSDFAQIVQRPSPKAQQQKVAAEIEQLVDAIEQLDQSGDEKDARPRSTELLDSARLQLSAAETELERLRAANASMQDQLQDAEELAVAARQSSADARDLLQSELAEFRQQTQALAEQLVQLRDDGIRQEKARVALSAEKENLSLQLARANGSVEQLEQALQQAQSAGKSLAAEAGALRADRRTLRDRVDELAGVERKLTDALAGRQQQLAELRTAEGERSAALEASRNEVNQLLAAIDAERRAKSELASALEDLRRQAKAGQEQLSALEDIDRQRQQQLANTQAEVERLQDALAQNRSQQLAATEQLTSALAELETIRQDRDGQRALGKTQMTALAEANSKTASLMERLGQRESDLQELRGQLATQGEQYQARQQELVTANATVAEQLEQLQESRTRIAGLEQDLAGAKVEQQALTRQRTQTEALNSELQRTLTQVWLTNALAVSDLDRARIDVARQRLRLTELEQDNAVKASQIEADEAQIAMLQRDLLAGNTARQSLQADVEQLRQRNAVQQELIGEAERKSDSSQIQMASLEESLRQQQVDNEKLQAELKQQRRTAESQVNVLAQLREAEGQRVKELEEARARLADLESQFEQRIAQQQKLLAERDQLVQQRDAQRQQAAQQAAESAAQTAALQTAQKEISRLQGALQASAEERQARDRELAAVLEQRRTENRRLQGLLAQSQAAQAKAGEQLQAERANVALAEQALREELQRRRDQAAIREQQLAVLQETEQKLGQTHAQLAELQRVVASAEEEKAVLRADLTQLQETDRQRQESIASMQGRANKRSKDLDEARARLVVFEDQIEQAAAQQQELLAALEQAQQQEKSQQQLVSELRDGDAARVAELDKTRVELAALRAQLDESVTEQQELLAALEQAQQQEKSQQQLVNELRDGDAARVAELDKTRVELAALRAQLNQSAAEQQQLSGELELAVQQRNAQRQQVAQQAAESAAQTAALQTAQKEIEHLQGALQTSAEERQTRDRELAAVLEQRQAENRRLQGLLAQSRAAQAKAGEQLQAQQADAARLEQTLRDAAATRQQQLAALQETERQLDQTRTQLAELQRVAASAQEEKAALLADLAQLQETDRQRQQAMTTLQESREQALTELAAVNTKLASQPRSIGYQPAAARVPQPTRVENQPSEPAIPPVVPAGAQMLSARPDESSPIATTAVTPAVSRPAAEPLARVASSAGLETPAAPSAKAAAGVEEFVRDWARAWSRQDVDAYLAHYAADFQPPDGASRALWAKQRRQRLTRPKVINVEVSSLEIATLNEQHVEVTFEQAYRANHYRDRVSKTLDLHLEDGQWKILREVSR